MKKTVKWVLKEAGKQRIKFEEDPDDSFEYADKVLPFVKDIKDGDAVDIDIEDSIVVKVSKASGEPAKAEVKEDKVVQLEEPISGNLQARKVKAITKNAEVLLFADDEANKIWTEIPEHLRENIFDFKGKDVLVTLGTVTVKGKEKQALESICLDSSVEVKEEVKTTGSGGSSNYYPETSSNKTGTSIEAQASMKSACEIVKEIVDKDADPDEILLMINKIGEANYDLIQRLKNR